MEEKKINKKYIVLRILAFPLKLLFMVFWQVIYGTFISIKWVLTGSQEIYISHSQISELVRQNERIIEILNQGTK